MQKKSSKNTKKKQKQKTQRAKQLLRLQHTNAFAAAALWRVTTKQAAEIKKYKRKVKKKKKIYIETVAKEISL